MEISLKNEIKFSCSIWGSKICFLFKKKKCFKVVIIGEKKYSRLMVPPRIWFGFKGLSKKESYILSLTNFSHKSKEVLRCEKNKIKFDWY